MSSACTTRPDGSAARDWPLLARCAAAERRLGARAILAGPIAAGCYEFLRFGVKQGWACLFGGLLLALLVATHLFYPRGAWLPRYDFLLLACLALAVREMRMSPAEALRAATAGGAAALRRDDVGALGLGKRADLVVLEAPSYVHLAYRPGVPLVRTVLMGGEPL